MSGSSRKRTFLLSLDIDAWSQWALFSLSSSFSPKVPAMRRDNVKRMKYLAP